MATARDLVGEVFAALDGDREAQELKAMTSVSGDFVHEPTGTFIEVDWRAAYYCVRDRMMALLG